MRPSDIVSVPPRIAGAATRLMGLLVEDRIITADEIAGLMRGLLCTDSPPAGPTRLSDRAREHAETLGVRYASELARRRNRRQAYENL